jgi:hypothetical protein
MKVSVACIMNHCSFHNTTAPCQRTSKGLHFSTELQALSSGTSTTGHGVPATLNTPSLQYRILSTAADLRRSVFPFGLDAERYLATPQRAPRDYLGPHDPIPVVVPMSKPIINSPRYSYRFDVAVVSHHIQRLPDYQRHPFPEDFASAAWSFIRLHQGLVGREAVAALPELASLLAE